MPTALPTAVLAFALLAIAGGCRSYEVVTTRLTGDAKGVDYEIVREKATGRLGLHDPKLGRDAAWYAPPDIVSLSEFSSARTSVAIIQDRAGKFGLITREGKIAFRPMFSWASLDFELQSIGTLVKNEQGLLGLAAANGRMLVPCEATHIIGPVYPSPSKILIANYPDQSYRVFHIGGLPLTLEAFVEDDRRVYESWAQGFRAGRPQYILCDLQVALADELDKTPAALPGDDGLSGRRPAGIDTDVMRAHWRGQKKAAQQQFGQ